ncbi:ABCD4 [Bugula neritina]|uniref:ABCD4 n=1 Tax=Bugula neritina TaxID=10212 RepID=A0A7J7KMS7_BUGNE|nr:ABCD4 [Bugula neritina]
MLITLKQLKVLCDILFLKNWKVITLLIVGQLCTALLNEVVIYVVGIIPSKFYLILDAVPAERSYTQLTTLVIYSLCWILIISLMNSFKTLITGIIFVSWRDVLTLSLHKDYYANTLSTYRANQIAAADPHTNVVNDNPDQRIASDAKAVCDDMSQLVPVLVVSPFIIGYYSYQSNAIAGYRGPLAVVGFFVLATIINLLLMRPVARWTYELERQEGNFRYCHMLTRVHCESSAFYNVNKLEEENMAKGLRQLLSVQEQLVYSKLPQNFFISLCDYVVSIISFMLIALPIFSGSYDHLTAAGVTSLVSQFSFQTIYLFNCFTTLIDLAKQAAVLLGNTARVTGLIQLLRDISKGLDDQKTDEGCYIDEVSVDRRHLVSSSNELQPQSAYVVLPYVPNELCVPLVTMDKVDISTPDGPTLIHGFNFEFREGVNVLITGASGCGKSSILRYISGLWPATSGRVLVRGDIGIGSPITILPQRPFFLPAQSCLYHQVFLGHIKPDQTLKEATSQVKSLLTEFGLTAVLERVEGLSEDASALW